MKTEADVVDVTEPATSVDLLGMENAASTVLRNSIYRTCGVAHVGYMVLWELEKLYEL